MPSQSNLFARGGMEEYNGNVPVAGQIQHDIVSSLPLELLFQVVEYLDAADIVRSQRVRP